MEKLPLYTVDLLKELDAQLPSRCPALDDPERAIWFYAGKRAVVEHLLMRQRLSQPSDAPADEDPES